MTWIAQGTRDSDRDLAPHLKSVATAGLARPSRRALLVAGAAFVFGLNRRELLRAEEKAAPTMTGFVPPDAAQRRAALGSLKGLVEPIARAYDPADHFEPMPAPQPGDWLAEHYESRQTYDDYVGSLFNRPDARRSKIYFLPFGEFDPDWSPKLSDLEACAAAFFQTPVKALPPRPMTDFQITQRDRAGNRQYLTRDFLRVLPGLLPPDGYAILGITMHDLYPAPERNWVFGQGSLLERVGIYSFARFDPQFWDEPRTPAARKQLLVRSLGVLLHETCHIYGLQHCIYYRCLVNGSNSLTESSRTPLHLCPICLRKLQHVAGFNVVTRYEKLLREYRRLGVNEESAWLERRLKFLRAK